LTSQVSRELLCTTHSAAQTRRLGRALARWLKPGDLICLVGELGAGKTTFVQGLGRGLGVADGATSPSFTLMHQHRGRLPLFHLDLYRLGPGDLADIGLEEVFGGDAVVAVEWAERLPGRLCADGIAILFRFDEAGRNLRQLTFHAHGPRGQQILDSLCEGSPRGEAHARPRA
jgi:tRNA threonylcarbamoyladenosine biosynthesis protein TsaE